jgi:two-component system, chemotaxis family, chemotaxis protein CheY
MRFLIVDDDESVILFLRMVLSTYAECLTACNGVEALSAFEAALEEERPFTAVFMDILMPDMNGTQVVQELRRLEEAHDPVTPFKLIMISVLTDTKNVSESFFHGRADAYLPKPLIRELVVHELAKLGLTATEIPDGEA